MCAANRALGSENQELRGLKDEAKSRIQVLEALVAEKDEKFTYVITKLKRTSFS